MFVETLVFGYLGCKVAEWLEKRQTPKHQPASLQLGSFLVKNAGFLVGLGNAMEPRQSAIRGKQAD